METIKVNMSPNPLDVQTIHASQNDNEAREWEFELHNNGEVIDASEITDQLVFKAYEGGTEQILPENGSTPTTSPFIGDIRYPQGLLSDQEFLYRESPTESDGNAKIQAIYGNTLKWNQLVQNGNFADGINYYTPIAATITASDGILTITKNQNAGAGVGYVRPANFNYVVGHKYFARVDYKGLAGKQLVVFSNSANAGITQFTPTDENWHTVSNIFSVTALPSVPGILWLSYETTTNDNVAQFKNYAIFDLTEMFGSGNEPSTVEEFTSLFPLPYYSYDSGSLLPFMGEGLKTVGKNLFDENSVLLSQGFVKQNDGSYYKDNLAILSNVVVWSNDAHINGALNIKFKYKNLYTSGSQGLRIIVIYTDGTRRTVYTPISLEFTLLQHQTESSKMVNKILWDYGSSANGTYIKDFIISVDNIDYEPYTSSTLSLPISTYFPNGMKSVGNAYDELTPSKAITRIGSVDLGSLKWVYYSAQNRFAVVLNNGKPSGTGLGLDGVCDKYAVSKVRYAVLPDQSLSVGTNFFSLETCAIVVHDENYTDATTFKQAMADQNAKLYYELATPTETSFTTASLVTENAEIPLSNEDGVLIGKCTEQLSENPGFFDGKIKLADGDGECYSNKIQLHIERSPQ